MLLFVAACCILLYWPVIDFFFASVKTRISIQLLLLRHFASLCETLLFYDCFASSTWMSHRRLCLILVELHKRRSDFHICVGISLKSSSRAVSNLGQERSVPTLIHMMLQCALRCCATCIGTVLDKCWTEAIELMSLPLSEQKLFQPKHDDCFFVTTKLCITPFISRSKHMLLLRPLSPGTVYAFC